VCSPGDTWNELKNEVNDECTAKETNENKQHGREKERKSFLVRLASPLSCLFFLHFFSPK
jgi:threonine/homoserine/homoserine lactone efflux protein